VRLLRVLSAATLQAGVERATAQPPSTPTARGAPSRPRFQLQRAEEDWGAWRGTTGAQRLKRVPLGGDAFLTLGGDVRLYPERFTWEDFGVEGVPADGYVMRRVMAHADLRFPTRAVATDALARWRLAPRVFAQMRSGTVSGRRGSARPPDTDTLGVHQLFAELALRRDARAAATEPPATAQPRVAMRVGRQELFYGAARVLHVREGTNVRQSFDAARLILRRDSPAGAWRVDLLAATVAPTNPGTLDDGREASRRLWGAYASGPAPRAVARRIAGAEGPAPVLDLFYLGHARDRARFAQGAGAERRHTLGARLAGRRRLHAGELTFDWEPMLQFGRFAPEPAAADARAPGRIRAWTVATETGLRRPDVPLAPAVLVRADVASGDRDPGDGDLETFHPLYPRGNYFGQMSPVGPANFVDLHPRVELSPVADVMVTFEWLLFWRQSVRDGVYNSVGALLLPAGAAAGRFVGHQPAATLAWEPGRHASVALIAGAFAPGRHVRETSPGRRIGYVGGSLALRF